MKNVRGFIWKKIQYLGVIFSMYLNRRVFVMYDENTLFLIVSLKLNLLFNLYHFMGKFSIRQIDDIFLIFSQKIGFDNSYKSVKNLTIHANCLQETICMNCQSLCFGKNKKKKCRVLKFLRHIGFCHFMQIV